MRIAELADAFLTANHRTFQPNTRRGYRSDLVLLARTFATLHIDAVTVAHLQAFLTATADLAPATLARRQAARRSCFGWAYRNDMVPADPTAKLERVTVPQRDPRPLTEAQAEALLARITIAGAMGEASLLPRVRRVPCPHAATSITVWISRVRQRHRRTCKRIQMIRASWMRTMMGLPARSIRPPLTRHRSRTDAREERVTDTQALPGAIPWVVIAG